MILTLSYVSMYRNFKKMESIIMFGENKKAKIKRIFFFKFKQDGT